MDFVPDGYDVINEPRADGRRGGGLAVVFKASINVTKVVNFVHCTMFDTLTVAIGTNANRSLLVNVYRPLDTSICSFLEEFAGNAIITGDFNYPGATSDTVDGML